jgi:hypothetical protein
MNARVQLGEVIALVTGKATAKYHKIIALARVETSQLQAGNEPTSE